MTPAEAKKRAEEREKKEKVNFDFVANIFAGCFYVVITNGIDYHSDIFK